jgi:hypothetical protein
VPPRTVPHLAKKEKQEMTKLIRFALAASLTTLVALPAAALPILQPTLPTVTMETGPDGIIKASIRCRSRTPGF